MANFKYLLFILSFIFIHNIKAQNYEEFFVEIQNSDYIPLVSHTYEGEKISSTKTGIVKLDDIINSYEIYSIKEVFKNSLKPSLQNIYLIECNDLQLMSDLINNYSQYYPRVEDAYREPLHLPNDFGTTGGYVGIDQEELNYIRAQEAWDLTTGSKDVIIGIADTNFQLLHEDLNGTIDLVINNGNNPNSTSTNAQHGSRVAAIAAANTNNGLGLSSIGYNSFIYAANGSTNGLDDMSQMSGVKVVNASWGSGSATPPTITPDVYDDIFNRNVVVVAAAGNGWATGSGDPNAYFIPASYKNVISVSSIGHVTQTYTSDFGSILEIFYDTHDWEVNNVVRQFQHNDSVDIVAPGYALNNIRPSTSTTSYFNTTNGTSYSSPMVCGAIALMFDLNYCLDPKEVETILKLTAVKIDHLPQNLQYYGKLGAGKLDAYEAVKMSKDMADTFGTVEVKNRILYRNWFYKLETAPYEIKMINNDVTGQSRLKFKARNNIEILSGDYYPDTGGYIDLQIDPNLDLNYCPPRPSNSQRYSSNDTISEIDLALDFTIYPTLIDQVLTVKQIDKSTREMYKIEIYNFFGQLVFEKEKINTKELDLNLQLLKSGIHILKIYDSNLEVIQTTKIVKK